MLLMTILALLTVWSGWFFLTLLNEQESQQIHSLKMKLQQKQALVGRLAEEVSRIKQDIAPVNNVQIIPNERVFQVMTVLTELPFTQGELQAFSLEENGGMFNGYATSQAEFEQIHQFLTQHFSHLTLSEFLPSKDGKLHFQFDVGS